MARKDETIPLLSIANMCMHGWYLTFNKQVVLFLVLVHVCQESLYTPFVALAKRNGIKWREHARNVHSR